MGKKAPLVTSVTPFSVGVTYVASDSNILSRSLPLFYSAWLYRKGSKRQKAVSGTLSSFLLTLSNTQPKTPGTGKTHTAHPLRPLRDYVTNHQNSQPLNIHPNIYIYIPVLLLHYSLTPKEMSSFLRQKQRETRQLTTMLNDMITQYTVCKHAFGC